MAYGRQLPEGDSYKKRALKERDIDWSRVHFTGLLPRQQYRTVLQASAVHVYLTVPFVLSWSMLEAMSAGCAIVASDVAPVREFADQAPGALRLTALAPEAAAAAINDVLDDRERATRMGAEARTLITRAYSAAIIFARKRNWLLSL